MPPAALRRPTTPKVGPLSWSAIRGIAQEVLGTTGAAANAVLDSLEDYFFGEGESPGENDNVTDSIWSKLVGSLGQAAFGALTGVVTSIATNWITKNLVKLATDWLAPLLVAPAGAAWQLLKLIYRGLEWLICQGKCLLQALAPILQIARAVLLEPVKAIGLRVVQAVSKLAGLALNAIVQLLTGVDIKKEIEDFLGMIKKEAIKLIRQLISKLLGKSGTPAEIKPKTCPVPRKQKSPGMNPGKPKKMKCRSSCSPAKTGQCFVGWTLVVTLRGKVKIRRRLVLEQVLTYPGAELAISQYLPGEEWRWSIFEVVLRYDEANWVRAVLLRPANWAVASTLVTLNLPEMGVVGDAWVVEVSPCPPLPTPRAGYRLVTAWFEHSNGEVLDLWVAGETTPVRGTPLHPVWVENDQCWKQLELLREGDRPNAADGATPVVERLEQSVSAERVYTIEVEGDHCFRIGEQRLLVHNQSELYTEIRVMASDGQQSVGRKYAKEASAKRRMLGGYFLKGEHNLAALRWRALKNGQPTVVIRIPAEFTSSSRGGDAEKQMFDTLTGLIRGEGYTCPIIVNLFTERTPCAGCNGIIQRAHDDFAIPTFNLYYLIVHPTQGAADLPARYNDPNDLNYPLT